MDNTTNVALPQQPHPSARSQRGLDWLNFCIADVEAAFGPFVSLYLARHGWSQGVIGSVLTINTAIALATQVPSGALVDWTRSKRSVVAACLLLIAGGALVIALFPHYLPVLLAEVMHGVTGGAVRNAVAAIGLGLVGQRAYSIRVGRNHRYDAFGNGLTAAAMGGLGHVVSPSAPFYVGIGLCVPAFLALWLVNGKEIDYARARGAEDQPHGQKRGRRAGHARWHALLRNRALVVLSGCLFLFQFANASLMPLTSEKLAANFKYESEIVVAALIVVPQAVTALIAPWVARKANEWGRKWLLAAGFVAQIALTGLFALAFGPWFLVGASVLGGATAAVIGILNPVIVADATQGTGRYNFSLGAVAMISGIGATVSYTAVGFVAQMTSFTIGFLVLGGAALLGLAAVAFLMPETVQATRKPVPPATVATAAATGESTSG